MKIEEFENAIKDLDKEKYQIGKLISVDKNGEPYLERWDIFRRNLTLEEMMNSNNLTILSSENSNTLEDIQNLINNN